MIVCIDSGNTRIKWGVHDGQRWLAQGSVVQAEVGQLKRLVAHWPVPDIVMLANVAGDVAQANIEGALAEWRHLFFVPQSSAQAAGVTNFYQDPTRLGIDRWCALIGARGLTQDPCVVVMAGTATTIDSLDAQGHFLGGLILPGFDAMRRALAAGTAALPFANGLCVDYPRCTDDAIVSGIVEAQVGAVERAFARLQGQYKYCQVSGGNANIICSRLAIPFRQVDNLPLEGLKQIGLEKINRQRNPERT